MNGQKSGESAAVFFSGEFNCAQSALLALRSYTDLSEAQAEGVAAGFGGGMKHQEICGAVSGACMALSLAVYKLHTGKSIEKTEAKDAAGDAVKVFMNRFKEEKEHVRCIDLTKYDFSMETERARFLEEGLRETICESAVVFAVELAEEIINEQRIALEA